MELSYLGVSVVMHMVLILRSYKCHGAAVYNTTEDRLYTHLFTNYKSHLRPVQDSNYHSPMTVNVQFGIYLIESLNEKEQKMTSYGFLTIYWQDQFLTWNPQDYGSISKLFVPTENVWRPEMNMINSVNGKTELGSSDGSSVSISNYGLILWVPLVKWESMCNVTVQDFPYDTHTCQILYSNLLQPTSTVNFTVNSLVFDSDVIVMPEWEMTETRAYFEQDSNTIGGYLPKLIMEVTLKRDPTFFELNVVLPALLLSVLLIPIFMLPVESGEKVSLGVTLMLAYSIFLLMMSDVIPRSGTLPRLTILVLVCISFSGVAVFLNVIIINLHHHSPEQQVPKWLRVLVIQKLGKILCSMRYDNANDIQPFDDQNEKKPPLPSAEKQVQNNTMVGKKFSGSDVDEIVNYLEFFKSAKIGEDEIANNKDEWNKVARVLDRLLLCIYTVFVVSSIISVLVLKFTR